MRLDDEPTAVMFPPGPVCLFDLAARSSRCSSLFDGNDFCYANHIAKLVDS